MSSKIRLHFPKELKANLLSTLSNEQSHYIRNVMRLKPGDIISLFNTTNGEWDAKIVNYAKETTELKIEKLTKNKKVENNLWLAFSPIKKNPLNMLIQKTTELGIQKFIPILSDRTVVREINTERVKKIIVEARNLDEVDEILKSNGVYRILLDNFDYDETREALKRIGDRCLTESSGGITEDTIRKYAECGVDYISSGALTHSVYNMDLSLKAV